MFKVDSAGIRKQLKWSRHTHAHTLTHARTHAHSRTHAHTHTHTRAHTHSHTHISSSIANLTSSWYFIKIKYSEPNISVPARHGWHSLFFCWRLSNSVALLRRPLLDWGWIACISRKASCTEPRCPYVTVRYEYMYRATPTVHMFL